MPRRIIKATDEATAGLVVDVQASKLSGDRDNFIHMCSDGISLVGNISFLTEPQNIRIGSMWTLPTGYQGMVPSNAINPQPMFIVNNPVGGVSSLAEEVARLIGELV